MEYQGELSGRGMVLPTQTRTIKSHSVHPGNQPHLFTGLHV